MSKLSERPLVFHQGVYKKTATTSEAIFLITGMTIGAGVLGVPYVIAQVGFFVGLIYLIFLSLIVLYVNLAIGEVASATHENLQLPGLAGKYLGSWAKVILSFTLAFGSFGALLAYIVGEGQTLANLFGGSSLVWTIIFWSIGGFVITLGLSSVKVFEKIGSLIVIVLLAGISFYLLPSIKTSNLLHSNLANIFLPYGIILFALHASPAIAEAHALLNNRRSFRRALIIGTIIPAVIYALFALAVVGVSGLGTTEIATVGLSRTHGQFINIFANLFAIFAMGTCFVGLGNAFRDTLSWDFHLPRFISLFFVLSVPLLLFLLGIKSFVAILEVVGGLFIAIEAILMILTYLQARAKGVVKSHCKKTMLLVGVSVLLFFTVIAIWSIYSLLIK